MLNICFGEPINTLKPWFCSKYFLETNTYTENMDLQTKKIGAIKFDGRVVKVLTS